ncbi:hypothetical protein HW555_000943, partial [Spodoptera exigua]
MHMLCVSKCADKNNYKEQFKDDYRDLNNKTIDLNNYCSDKWCIQKCCPPEHCINMNGICKQSEVIRRRLQEKYKDLFKLINYENITFYSNTEPRQRINHEFAFIYNYKERPSMFTPYDNEYYFSENAAINIYDAVHTKQWRTIPPEKYCVDFRLLYLKKQMRMLLVIKEYFTPPKINPINETLLLIGVTISSVFLLLVFIVHCMLKRLHSSFTGLLMMAYTITILLGFIIKVIMQATIAHLRNDSCKIITPFLYFLLLSSFFWLNAFSFCIWRGLRTNFGIYKVTRRDKLVSFSRYGLYAWGVPLLITGVAVYFDNTDITKLKYIIKPPFDDCFINQYGIERYYYIPLGIIMFINIVLFIMTIYHIMTTTNSTKNNAEFRRSGRENSYKTYMKLSLTMGISWVLELIPNPDNTFLFILNNTYNSLIGVIIFFVYICDKNVLTELCKKFNIQNEFVIKLAHRKSLFRLARSRKIHREELSSMQTATTGLSSE